MTEIGAGQDQARVISRLATDFVLRSLSLAASFHDGNVIRAVVMASIVAANTSHLNPRSGGAPVRYGDFDDLPPDSERRPISVLALSKSLSMSFETTRRHVNALVSAGLCHRVKDGVVVPAAVIASQANSELLLANVANVRRFARDLARVGVDAGPRSGEAGPSE